MTLAFEAVPLAIALILAASAARASTACEDYSAQSLVLAGKNLAYGCGFSGDRWSLDGRAHYAYCQAVGPRAAQHDRMMRAAMLRHCH